MKVSLILEGKTYGYDVIGGDIPSILSIIATHHDGLYGKMYNSKFRYVLFDPDRKVEPLELDPRFTFEDTTYPNLLIAEDISGEIQAAAIVTALASVGVATTAGSFLAIGLTALVNVGLSFAMSAIGNMLSPTGEIASGDPATIKQSNLWQGNVTKTGQGMSMPYLVGSCLASGIVLSAAIETTDL
jgi:predicted phage tail protein